MGPLVAIVLFCRAQQPMWRQSVMNPQRYALIGAIVFAAIAVLQLARADAFLSGLAASSVSIISRR
jgi:hypothetical protein